MFELLAIITFVLGYWLEGLLIMLYHDVSTFVAFGKDEFPE